MSHHFVFLPRYHAKSIGSKTYYPLKYCRRGHSAGRRTAHGSCKECSALKNTQYSKDNSIKVWFKNKRNNAKLRGVDFEISLDDVLPMPDKCPVLGISIRSRLGDGDRGVFDDSISLDRINPEIGYIKGNVKVISGRANRLKSDATLDELERIVAYIKRNQYGKIKPRSE